MYELIILFILFILIGALVILMVVTPTRIYTAGFNDENKARYLSNHKNNEYIAIHDARKMEDIIYNDPGMHDPVVIKNNQKYLEPSSGRQIQTAFRIGNSQDKARLSILLTTAGFDSFNRQLYNKSDAEIYKQIKPRIDRESQARADYHAKILYRNYYRAISDNKPVEPVYLDVGCMDGTISHAFGKLIGATEIHCVEPQPRGETAGVTITKEVNPYPFPDNKFDVVTAFMTLHHIVDLPAAVSDIIRVLKPGGYLMIKEHDIWLPVDCMLVDIEHRIHMTISGEIKPGEHLPQDYYISYRNYHAFDEIFSKLTYVKSNFYYGPDRFALTATRAYWAVYQKPM